VRASQERRRWHRDRYGADTPLYAGRRCRNRRHRRCCREPACGLSRGETPTGEDLLTMNRSLFLLALLIPAAQAATLNVGSGQTYASIQAASDAANPGDTVYV